MATGGIECPDRARIRPGKIGRLVSRLPHAAKSDGAYRAGQNDHRHFRREWTGRWFAKPDRIAALRMFNHIVIVIAGIAGRTIILCVL